MLGIKFQNALTLTQKMQKKIKIYQAFQVHFEGGKSKGKKTLGTGKDNSISLLIQTRFINYFIDTFCSYLDTKEVYKSNQFVFKSFASLLDKDGPRESLSSENINISI